VPDLREPNIVYHVLQGFPAEGGLKESSASMVGISEAIIESEKWMMRIIEKE
jgi:hypothetical protein